jgi:hypothetical protein
VIRIEGIQPPLGGQTAEADENATIIDVRFAGPPHDPSEYLGRGQLA